MTAILLRPARLDALDLDSETVHADCQCTAHQRF